ncbi:MAG: hypothetical protein IPG69_16375 [Flavobacteriales bacterium]|jgi:hypothetical protein|nr:hypothetical protein [Flavobacteriales bacterium]MBK7268053.1 hypothetical protein [Flavobacteriales bacterium]MBK7751291.1 hypothetical protein [Flavobacteriales bacterium]MBK9073638.1 hypothetical protein [Flavobacteriales bacterium]MBK9539336.1 hypothetical protein [Flavobacteriales bacterium]
MPANGRLSGRTLLLIGLLALFASVRWRIIGHDGGAWRSTIYSDGEGYAAYLTSPLLHGTLSPPVARPDHLVPAGTVQVIKYPAGTAFVQAPFVLVAHAVRWLSGIRGDTLTPHHSVAIALCGLGFLLLGLERVRWLLHDLGVADRAVAVTLVLLPLGTGLGYYALMAPSMSHVYSFAMIAVLLAAARKAWCTAASRALLLTSFAFGLVVLIRPTNAFALLALPMVTMGHPRTLRAWLLASDGRGLSLAAVLLVLTLCMQPLLWYLQCGSWFVRPYPGEGFNWTHPELCRSLFGAQKGLFFFWPLLLLVLPGLIALGRLSPRTGVWAVAYFAVLCYVTSSWWNWIYGDSYGPRPYLDHLAALAVPIAAFLGGLRPLALRIGLALIVPLCLLQCFHAWQYQVGILHPFNMDREKWRAVFLRTGPQWRHSLGGDFEPAPYAPCGMDTVFAEGPPQGTSTRWQNSDSVNGSFLVDRVHPTGPVLRIPENVLPDGRALLVEASLRRRDLDPGASRDALIVCTMGSDGADRVRYAFAMNDLPASPSWRLWRYAFVLPAALPGEHLSFSVQQPSEGAFQVDAPTFRLSAVRPCP